MASVKVAGDLDRRLFRSWLGGEQKGCENEGFSDGVCREGLIDVVF